ncbi:uncharacterized protein BXZ73DRAFT_102178 [Epithele typhae]|uniref:uncharacterized protein n=1 Tax=Epithele typhae TaxID=378194 RepID=UPI002008B9B4|nr:uncharacterized protein BXZ73DRAFT_102178 [Epithele typhae]KAH9929025.1 hypothetical protein BXZ73DRAFT_102178 [Epithele typhae]
MSQPSSSPSSSSETSSPTPSICSLVGDERQTILSYLPVEAKLIAVGPARVYHAPSVPPKSLGEPFEPKYWFRLVDVDGGKGIVWFHEIPSDLDYQTDKPFFHTFSGVSRMFGFRFDEDFDADKFRTRITSRITLAAPRAQSTDGRPAAKPLPASPPAAASAPLPRPLPEPPARDLSPAAIAQPQPPSPRFNHPALQQVQPAPVHERKPSRGRKLSASMISAPSPGSFVHVAHVGLDAPLNSVPIPSDRSPRSSPSSSASSSAVSTPSSSPPSTSPSARRARRSPSPSPRKAALDLDADDGWTLIYKELEGFGPDILDLLRGRDINFVEGFLAGAKASLMQELHKTPEPAPAPAPAPAPTRHHAYHSHPLQHHSAPASTTVPVPPASLSAPTAPLVTGPYGPYPTPVPVVIPNLSMMGGAGGARSGVKRTPSDAGFVPRGCVPVQRKRIPVYY